jgi:hypothetical protein
VQFLRHFCVQFLRPSLIQSYLRSLLLELEPTTRTVSVIRNVLKVVANEREGGWEAGYCLKTVLDPGDRCLSAF